LLLEAGDGNDGDATKILSERYSTFSDHPEINWGYKSVPQQVLGGRQVDYSRGKALGGSSAINFGVYTIGPMDDYDEWARLVGDDAFNWENTRRRYKKIENYHANLRPEYQKYAHPKPANHGTDGPLHVELAKIWEPEQLVFNVLDSARTYGFGNNLDINSGDPLGVGVAPNTSYKGYRRTAASAFLQDPPSNLKIIINSPVTKILIEDKRAVGVVADDEKCR
jgi:choline dehydrogenase-like flavoprotein